MASLGESYSGMFGWLIHLNFWIIFIFFLIIAVIICVIVWIKNKFIFIYPVRIFRTRENGKVKEKNCVGGYIGRKNSAPFFRIKTGWWWWQYVDLIETPKVQFIDQDDRVYYKQIDVNTFIQLKRIFDNSIIKFTPVESDVKYGAILSIQRIKEILRADNVWKKLAPYFALVLVFIAAILGWWFVMSSKCPSIG